MLRVNRRRAPPCVLRAVRMLARRVSFQTFGLAFLALYILFVVWTIKVMWGDSVPTSPTHLHWKGPEVESKLENAVLTAFRPRQPEQVKPMQCYNTEEAINAASVSEFQTLDDQTYFLNAFFDSRVRNETSIRILAMRAADSLRKPSPVYCLLNSADNHSLMAVEATPYAFTDNHHEMGLSHGGHMLSCSVRGVLYTNPCKVRLSLGKSFANKTITMQLLSLKANKPRRGVGVCVPPVWGVVQMNKLVEFIELTHILGAAHIFFYQFMGDADREYSNPNVHHVLSHYRSKVKKKVTVYPWNIPISMQGKLYYFGQTLALHHCLYTNMWKYKYIIFNDIDEFLVPRKVDSWNDLMPYLNREDTTNVTATSPPTNATGPYAGYCFKSPFFPPEVSESLRTMSSVTRTTDTHQVHSKCIVHPERVFEMGIYKIHKTVNAMPGGMDVGIDTALLHHYRSCDQEVPWHIKCFETKRDDIMLKYNAELVENYRAAMNAIATN